jgi:hypothetical protein
VGSSLSVEPAQAGFRTVFVIVYATLVLPESRFRFLVRDFCPLMGRPYEPLYAGPLKNRG